MFNLNRFRFLFHSSFSVPSCRYWYRMVQLTYILHPPVCAFGCCNLRTKEESVRILNRPQNGLNRTERSAPYAVSTHSPRCFPLRFTDCFPNDSRRLRILTGVFTTPRKFDLGRNRFNLTADAPTAYPWANSIAVLVYPYAPFMADERIPAYYIASNRAYHSAKNWRKP